MENFLADRLGKVKPSPTLEISKKAAELKAQGQDVLNLSVGEPDFNTPDHVIEAAYQAMKKGQTKYTAVEGTPALKDAIIQKFKTENGLSYTRDEIIVSTGGKQVIYNALMATLNPGDEVIIPAPYWVSYPDMVLLAGGVPVIIEATQDLKITPHQLEQAITPRTKWLILNSPSNPTGVCYTALEIKALCEVVKRHPQVHVLSDDIYEHLIYDGFQFATAAQMMPELKDRILTLNGVSKAYAMTGWRIGYAGGHKDLIKAMGTIQGQSTSNACSISQAASVAALMGPQDFLTGWRERFQARRDLVMSLLSEAKGLSYVKPHGAFYLYVSCEGIMGKKTSKGHVLETDTDVARYLLEDHLIAVVPGEVFGLSPYIRISYATDEAILTEACQRMVSACGAL